MVEPNFGLQGKFDPESRIGSTFCSTSFPRKNESEILVFYGVRNGWSSQVDLSDQIWKYSITENQWMFVKGRKERNQNDNFLETNLNSFNHSIEISSRAGAKGWGSTNNEGEIINFFGGFVWKHLNRNSDYYNHQGIVFANEMWRFNTSDNSYAFIHFNTIFNLYTYPEWSHNFEEVLSSELGIYHENNHPVGRAFHEIVQLNNEEVLLVGGMWNSEFSTKKEFLSDISSTYINVQTICSDWWIWSNTLMQWKKIGGKAQGSEFGSSETWEETPIYGTKDVYDKNNTIGARFGHSLIKISDEEVLLFGGEGGFISNAIQKFNTTSYFWKYISGNHTHFDPITYTVTSPYAEGYTREFNEINLPGGRKHQKMFLLNNEEVLLFAGIGLASKTQNDGYLNDEWIFNLKKNFWKFSGTEASKYINRRIGTTFGGMSLFFGEYLQSKNEIIILNGEGNSGIVEDIWRLYYGNICNSIEDRDPNVCLKRGECIGFNKCLCDEDLHWHGDNCDLYKCNGILSNETDVCSRKGICSYGGQCACYEHSPYTNPDCSVDEELQYFMTNLWIFITIPIVIVLTIIVLLIIIISVFILFLKLKKTTKKFEGIEDIDLILEEAKLQQNTSKPKITIDKSLFEIDYKDLQLFSVLGEGGSQSVIYLAKWKGTYCAYKGFLVGNQTSTTDDFSFEEFEKEVKIYSSIRHPSILQFYGACVNLPHVGIILEYCRLGDVPKFLEKCKLDGKGYSIKEKIRILTEIAKGMHYLHSINLFHRDLKPENVLIDDNEHAKIMDFGISRFTKKTEEEKTMTKRIGTSFYMSPEVFKGEKYTNKCDVFSFAILMYVVISENYFPYGNTLNEINILRKVASSSNYRPKIESNMFKNCKFIVTLMQRNWENDPKKRNSFEEIIEILSKKSKNIIDSQDEYSNHLFILKKKIKEEEELIKKLKRVKEITNKENSTYNIQLW